MLTLVQCSSFHSLLIKLARSNSDLQQWCKSDVPSLLWTRQKLILPLQYFHASDSCSLVEEKVISVSCDLERQLIVFWKMNAFRGGSSASVRAL